MERCPIYRFSEQSFRRYSKLKAKEKYKDRTIYEDAHIFAFPNLILTMGLMTNRDFQNYSSSIDGKSTATT
jgi:deoxyadenosine/deoxycytidine kinase